MLSVTAVLGIRYRAEPHTERRCKNLAQITLGSTGITTDRSAFGALPIQRANLQVAIKILRKAHEGGMKFFDTARAYSDSEEKLGIAFEGIRESIFIATKTQARTPEAFWKDLETSLGLLKTDYIDIYQFHNPSVCYRPGDKTGMYECMLDAKSQGKIRHIGLTSHRLNVAHACIDSGLYETLQFPLSYLSSQEEIELAEKCAKAGMGFIAMKALAGGLITDSATAYAYMSQLEHVLPIWGIQRETELDEFLSHMEDPPQLTGTRKAFITQERQELSGEFCRGCGYCMPCPVGIEINTCARVSLLLRRSPSRRLLEPETQAKMRKIENCLECGECTSKCPYDLDTPGLLKRNYEDYQKILAGEVRVDK